MRSTRRSSGAVGDPIRYPRLRPGTPVLRRGPGEIQVGVDSISAVVVPDAEEGLEELLRLCDGCRPRDELDRHVRRLGLEPSRTEKVMNNLAQASLLVEGRDLASGRGRTAQVRLIGAGPIGKAIADLLAPELSRLHLIDGDLTDVVLYPTAGALATQADALQAHLRHRNGARVSVWNHWSKPEGVRLDLTIVTTAMVETDRVVPDELLRTDQPHLFVRATETGGVVGPLVIPGATACLHCTDLFRRDRDPAWPSLLSQLTRIPAHPTPVVGSWVAATAAAQALGFLAGDRPESSGATLELAVPDHRIRWRPWPAHPRCGCGWLRTAE